MPEGMAMKEEGRWIIFIISFGALLADIFHNAVGFLAPDSWTASVIIWVAFFVCLIMSPSYSEVSDYWRRKYGK